MSSPAKSYLWSGFWTGALAIIASWIIAGTFSGCEFGNKVVEASNPDTISGYYLTQPQTYEVSATAATTRTASQNTNLLPPEVTSTFTNPIILAVQDLTTGQGQLGNPDPNNPNAFPIFVSIPSLALSYVVHTTPTTLWTDPACTQSFYIQETGQVTQTPTSLQGVSVALLGRIQLTLEILQSFDGTCAPTLLALSQCYNDVTQCGASTSADNQSLQTSVQSLFNSYIQAGVMTASDIPNMQNLGYTVTFQ